MYIQFYNNIFFILLFFFFLEKIDYKFENIEEFMHPGIVIAVINKL